MTPARELARQISCGPVRPVFGVPGGGPSLELIDSLASRGVDFVRTTTEGSAALMAGTWGRLTGNAGIAISIKGPGLANMVSGLAACRLEAFPAVAITEAYPSDAPPSFAHKRLDHRALSAAVVKGHRFFSSDGPTFAELAAWSEDEIPGPVLLDLSLLDGRENRAAARSQAREPIGDEWISLVADSQRPVVIAGTLAIRNNWSSALGELELPVFSTAAAKGVYDETFPTSAGVFTGAGGSLAPESWLLKECDLVVGFGLRSNEVLRAEPFGTPSINVDREDLSASPGLEFTATVGPSRASEVFSALKCKSWGLERLAPTHDRLRRHLLGQTFLPAAVYEAIWDRFEGDACLVLDTGDFCTVGEHMWKARTPSNFLGAGQSRYMGTGLPMAIAASLWNKGRPTVAAIGDGGIGMGMAELRAAVSRRLPVIVAFMCDGGFASIRHRARKAAMAEEPLLISDPSWQAVAAGLGIPAFVIQSVERLEQVLCEWKITDGPLFLECRFDPDSYLHMTENVR